VFRSGPYTVPELYAGLAVDGSGWESTPGYGGHRWFNVERSNPRALEIAGGAFLGDGLGKADRSVLGGDIRRLEDRGLLGEHRSHLDDAFSLLARADEAIE
jgi:hypothetical protein